MNKTIITGFYNFSIIFQVFVNNIHINISYFFVLRLNILLFINEPLRFSGDPTHFHFSSDHSFAHFWAL